MNEEETFARAYRGYFKSLLRWSDLDALWNTLRASPDRAWYIYAVGEAVPAAPSDPAALETFIGEIDVLLRREHDEDYCGIVYADNPAAPRFIKIYDPNNLGSVCGPGAGPPPPPGWILSTLPPQNIETVCPPPANRRRWWQRIWSRSPLKTGEKNG